MPSEIYVQYATSAAPAPANGLVSRKRKAMPGGRVLVGPVITLAQLVNFSQ